MVRKRFNLIKISQKRLNYIYNVYVDQYISHHGIEA